MVMAVVDGAPVQPALVVERVERRGRLSVAFRLLLVLPQVVVLYVLLLVGLVAVVVGWFAALVLGRLPEPIARYLCHLTRYTTRVYAYSWLLTDRYPPFRFSAQGYPVQVELAPGRLNRLAVLFRLFLAIPASILAGLVVAGWSVAAFVIWLLVLVAGRVPGSLFDATTAVLRYNMRTTAYTWLVTAAYPWGLSATSQAPPLPLRPRPAPARQTHRRQSPARPRRPAPPKGWSHPRRRGGCWCSRPGPRDWWSCSWCSASCNTWQVGSSAPPPPATPARPPKPAPTSPRRTTPWSARSSNTSSRSPPALLLSS
jgi:Domain of unknown function (DUF4389)